MALTVNHLKIKKSRHNKPEFPITTLKITARVTCIRKRCLCKACQQSIFPENGAGTLSVYHKCACSELWSLSWLSSFASESPVCWRPAALMPESSEGSSVPFFTFTSSFSRAAAPCWPPFTRFHFIRLFWNQTFTFAEERQNKKTKVGSLKVIMTFLAVAQQQHFTRSFFVFFFLTCLFVCVVKTFPEEQTIWFWVGREPWGCEDNDCKRGKGVTARRRLGYLQQVAPAAREDLRAL